MSLPFPRIGLLLAALMWAPGLAAHDYELLPIVIESDGTAYRMTLAEAEGELPFARCRGACLLYVWPGEYWLTVGATAETVEGSRRLALEEPSRIRVTPIASGRGVTLGLVGTGLLVGGVLTTVYVATNEDEHDDVVVIPAVLALATGLVLATIGAAQAGRTAPKLEIERLGR